MGASGRLLCPPPPPHPNPTGIMWYERNFMACPGHRAKEVIRAGRMHAKVTAVANEVVRSKLRDEKGGESQHSDVQRRQDG